MLLKYDFHIHSCLSPCGDIQMTPGNIAGMAKIAGFDVIALSDHNTVKNCPAFLEACSKYEIIGIPGMELNTRDEVHVLCLFPDLDAAMSFDKFVYDRLPDISNKPELFGEQLIMDVYNNVIGIESKLLINATDIGIYEVEGFVGKYGGVAIPSHMDRTSFSILSNLGFYDKSLGFNVVEFSADADVRKITAKNPELTGVRFVVDSDAHMLGAIHDASRVIETRGTSLEDIINAIKERKHLPEI